MMFTISTILSLVALLSKNAYTSVVEESQTPVTVVVTQTVTGTGLLGKFPSCYGTPDGTPKSDECLLEIWQQYCPSTYPTGESKTDPLNAYWRYKSAERIDEDMANWLKYSSTSKFYCDACYGPGNCPYTTFTDPCDYNATQGQSSQCLAYLWGQAGCYGTYPTGEPVDGYWHSLSIPAIQADMNLYFSYSYINPKYCSICRPEGGCDILDPCAYPETVNVVRSDECLMSIWKGVGCVTDAPLHVKNTSYWKRYDVETVKKDMTKYYQRSFPSNDKYTLDYCNICMGNCDPQVTTVTSYVTVTVN